MTPRTFATPCRWRHPLLLRITTTDAVVCGSAFAPAGGAWALPLECDDLIGTRRAWAWPLLLVGLFTVIGARYVRFTPAATS